MAHDMSLPVGDRDERDDEEGAVDMDKLFTDKQVLQEVVQVPSPLAIWTNADLHGWHNPPADLNTDLLLIHSEVSEACEGARAGRITSKDGKGSVGEELADAVIRIFHTAKKNDIDIVAELHRKHKINMGRPFRHGNKAF